MTHKFVHRLISLFVALAVMLAGVTSALGADGTLDPSFGTGGILTTDFFGRSDFGTAVTVQPDDKIIMAGFSLNGSDYDFALVRYNTDGSLDTTFDTDGKATTDFGIGSNDIGHAVALQPDGKIIVAGITYNGSNYDIALVRYNNDGL